jgi:RNA 2',3'-cyclic 3'-phosphodiesterase
MSNNLIRCFIAVSLPQEILDQIGLYLQELKNISPRVRWVKPTAIHITLKFLAEQSQEMVKIVEKELTSLGEVCPPFELSVAGTGCFPNRNRPRVFWLGLEHDAKNSLFNLHEWIDQHLEPLGFEREKRRFSPHLTLGRVKEPSDHQNIFDHFARNPFPVSKFTVKEVVFMQSELRPKGAKYTPIGKYLLKSP